MDDKVLEQRLIDDKDLEQRLMDYTGTGCCPEDCGVAYPITGSDLFPFVWEGVNGKSDVQIGYVCKYCGYPVPYKDLPDDLTEYLIKTRETITFRL